MLHPIRKLARAIHRRSIWQVLGTFLVLSWPVMELVAFLTVRIGLPSWTPGMAFVLLLIGLPIVLATTVVQGGLPWLRIEDLVDPNELAGLTPDQVQVIPAEHPMHGVAFFTWRNAILGGVMAGALLTTSVVAYLTMWALGVGPMGSLVAQGVLEPGDAVIMADIAHDMGDPSAAERVAEVLAANLALCPVVEVLDRNALTMALDSMGHPEDEVLGRPAALELAAREALKAVVHGEVTMIRGRYRVSAGILRPDGTQLARYQAIADSQDELPAAVQRVAEQLREKFGESLRSIRASAEAPAGG